MSETAAEVSEVETGDSGGNVGGTTPEQVSAPNIPTADVGSDWRDGLDPSVRNSLDVDSIEDLAKGYVNAQQMIGGSIRIPGKDAGEADWNKFYDKFKDVPGLARYNPDDLTSLYDAAGRPGSPKEYGVEGVDEDFLSVAYDAGLNRSQVEAISEYTQNLETYKEGLIQQQVDSGIQQLRQEWGLAFDRKVEEGQRAVAHLEKTIPGLGEALDSSGAGNNAAIIKLFQTLGANLKEGQGFAGTHEGTSGLTPYEARMQIQEIQNNPQHPYHRGDESAMERFLELHKFATAR